MYLILLISYLVHLVYAIFPCIPAKGKTALIIGQDYDSIINYTNEISQPFGYMTYTAITFNMSSNLAGVLEPLEYGSGIEWAKGLLEFNPNAALQIGTTLYTSNTYLYIINNL
jgi:hypothetical protein